jgi:hypothetical protein
MRTKSKSIIEFHYPKFIKIKVTEKNLILENLQILIFQYKIKNSKLIKFKKIIFHKNMMIRLINSKKSQFIDI